MSKKMFFNFDSVLADQIIEVLHVQGPMQKGHVINEVLKKRVKT